METGLWKQDSSKNTAHPVAEKSLPPHPRTHRQKNIKNKMKAAQENIPRIIPFAFRCQTCHAAFAVGIMFDNRKSVKTNKKIFPVGGEGQRKKGEKGVYERPLKTSPAIKAFKGWLSSASCSLAVPIL